MLSLKISLVILIYFVRMAKVENDFQFNHKLFDNFYRWIEYSLIFTSELFNPQIN